MLRTALALSAILLLCACPPGRGGNSGDDDDDGGGSGPGSAWLVVTSTSEGETSVSHSFIEWNRGAGLCSAIRSYYGAYASGYGAYTEAYTALEEDFGPEPDTTDPEYRLRYCEMYVLYYDAYYGYYGAFGAGTEVMALNLGGGAGAPAAGTYTASDWEDDEEDESTTFTGGRTDYLVDYPDVYSGYDCAAYANDPEAELFADIEVDEEIEYTRYHDVVGGTLEVTESGADAWILSLTDGLSLDPETAAETPFELNSSTFERCEVEFSYEGGAR